MQSVKCVFVGDSSVGKSSLIQTFVKKTFTICYPTVFDMTTSDVTVDGQLVRLNLWDSTGMDGYERLRPMQYVQADVFIICFSIDCPASLRHVSLKWHPEIKQHCPDVPILLVGTKSDLRDDPEVLEKLKEQNLTTVAEQQGTQMAEQIQAVKYLECAAINQEGLDEVFDEAVHVFLSAASNKPCVLL